MSKSVWICREKGFWRDVAWEPGDNIEMVSPEGQAWKLGGTWWAPSGVTVVDIKAGTIIPWWFEPIDMSVLENPKDIYLARDHKKNERDWKFTWEADVPVVPIEDLPIPESLTPDTLKQLSEDPDLLVTETTKRERLKRGPRKPRQ
jgi:hypothetical protein